MKKGEISKKILNGIMLAGGFYIACSSPRFARRAIPEIFKHLKYKAESKKRTLAYKRSFYYLWKRKLINVEYRGKQMYISLSKEGEKVCASNKFNELRPAKQNRWDKKWRILIFDIPDKDKTKREALRGKIKEMNFFQLQKSVWVYPYDFQSEINFLRDFFSFEKGEIQTIVAEKIENDSDVKAFFGLK